MTAVRPAETAAGEVRTATARDRAAIRSLWRERFGDLGDSTHLDAALGDGAAATGFVAESGEGVVGFATVSLFDPDTASGYVGGVYPPTAFPDATGVIHQLAVDSSVSDRRVGSALTRRCMDWARGRTPMMLVVLWRRPDHVDGSVLAERFDYDEVVRLKGYYRGRREHCPDCGQHCTCDATVHVRPLSQRPTDEQQLENTETMRDTTATIEESI